MTSTIPSLAKTDATSAAPVPPTAPVAPAPLAEARPSGLRRLSFGLLMVYVAILAINSGGLGILIPDLVARIDEANKVGNLAIVSTVAFLATVLAQPIAGAGEPPSCATSPS